MANGKARREAGHNYLWPRFLAPAYENWKEEIKKERPDLYCAYNPWDRVTDVKSLMKLMRDGGTSNIEVIEEKGKQPLMNAEDWWLIALGTGLRWTIDQLSSEATERVKRANLKWLVKNTIDTVETNVIYAVATKDRSEFKR